jgi:hypothetical protein
MPIHNARMLKRNRQIETNREKVKQRSKTKRKSKTKRQNEFLDSLSSKNNGLEIDCRTHLEEMVEKTN